MTLSAWSAELLRIGLMSWPFVLLALASCRFLRLPAMAKVWLCRIALLKLALSVWLVVPVAVAVTPTSPWFLWESTANRVFGFLGLVWFAGFFVVLGHAATSYRAMGRVRKLALAHPRPDIEEAARHLGFRISAYESSGLTEPCVTGWFRRSLLVPEGWKIDCHILHHEIAHLRHGDLAWGAFMTLMRAQFWFVPGLGRMHQEMTLWQEVRADRWARTQCSMEAGEQAAALLDALSRRRASSWAAAGFTGDAAYLARRFEAMFAPAKAGVSLLVVALVAAATLVPFWLDPQFTVVPVRRQMIPVATRS